jgi:hypothetical protein
MGEELGGRPKDRSCYDAQDRVLYEICKQRPEFQHGIERLRTAWGQGRRVALLCSESRPENCHRSKLIGPALIEHGIEVTHLDEDGTTVSQQEVMARVEGGQPSLFPEMPAPQAARSRGRYAAGDR